ncbi:DUF1284 domain-containing protein [Bacteroidota bacterium]
MSLSYPQRGTAYEDARDIIERLLQDETKRIEMREVPDILCQPCPYFDGQACAHPEGDETAVKKWDAAILKVLGLEPGQTLSVPELKSLIKERAPLSFCITKCPYCHDSQCNPRMIRDILK